MNNWTVNIDIMRETLQQVTESLHRVDGDIIFYTSNPDPENKELINLDIVKKELEQQKATLEADINAYYNGLTYSWEINPASGLSAPGFDDTIKGGGYEIS